MKKIFILILFILGYPIYLAFSSITNVSNAQAKIDCDKASVDFSKFSLRQDSLEAKKAKEKMSVACKAVGQ